MRVMKTLLKRVCMLCAVGMMPMVVSYAQNLVQNGSFETPTSNNLWATGNPNTWFAGQTFDGAWFVEVGSVDILNMPTTDGEHVRAFAGNQWVDLSGSVSSPLWGAIYQDITIPANAGGQYSLRFAMNGNYASGSSNIWDYRQLRVQVLLGNSVVFQAEPIHYFNNSFAHYEQPWMTLEYVIVLNASATYRLRFESLETRSGIIHGSCYGPALDDVRLELVPEPASVVALGSGLASLLALRRRKR